MDIIIIELPNGEYHSSSFHVRFSAKQVLTSDNVDVLIYINNKKTEVKMKLAKSGDAYFNITDKKKVRKNYSLFPDEAQIKKLELNEGINSISFAIKTFLGGIQILKSNLFFWKYPPNLKFILWDIDGTITKSDILGVILPRLGFNWNHENVIEFINKLYNNNYKIIYLTARAIFQSEATHDFLYNISQGDKSLPKGPIIMDPDGAFSSFKKGVIQKQQYLIKILSLLEIKNLFNDNEQHFYAGFGNKETDAIAYRYLGIDLNKIFIINSSSNITQLNEKNKTNYDELYKNCDTFFPKII